MTAWKPPERVWVRPGVYDATLATHHTSIYTNSTPYIPESTAQERERVLREALERYVALQDALRGDGVPESECQAVEAQARAALDSQEPKPEEES